MGNKFNFQPGMTKYGFIDIRFRKTFAKGYIKLIFFEIYFILVPLYCLVSNLTSFLPSLVSKLHFDTFEMFFETFNSLMTLIGTLLFSQQIFLPLKSLLLGRGVKRKFLMIHKNIMLMVFSAIILAIFASIANSWSATNLDLMTDTHHFGSVIHTSKKKTVSYGIFVYALMHSIWIYLLNYYVLSTEFSLLYQLTVVHSMLTNFLLYLSIAVYDGKSVFWLDSCELLVFSSLSQSHTILTCRESSNRSFYHSNCSCDLGHQSELLYPPLQPILCGTEKIERFALFPALKIALTLNFLLLLSIFCFHIFNTLELTNHGQRDVNAYFIGGCVVVKETLTPKRSAELIREMSTIFELSEEEISSLPTTPLHHINYPNF